MGSGWRMDETSIKVKGQWKYLYRAVDREGQTIDFLLTAHRDKKAALRFLKKAVRHHGFPVIKAGPIPPPSKRSSKKPVKKSSPSE
jgi:transposase-like protein